MDDREFERDEDLLEARRLRRMEQKRKRMIRSRIMLGGIGLALILLIVLIAKGCANKSGSDEDQESENTQAAAPVKPQVPEKPRTAKATLSAVGDIMIYDSQIQDAKQEDGTYNFLSCLAPVSTLLTASDLTVGNFEATFAGEPYTGRPDFRAPDSLADTLAGYGFDILQTANTYSIQNGVNGMTRTIDTIRNAGMATLGTYLSPEDKAANQVVIREVNGIKFAFVAFTKALNGKALPAGYDYSVDLLCTDYSTTFTSLNSAGILEALEAAKAQNPDVIVAMVHWGSEYDTSVSNLQSEAAELMINNGVDVILGTHPHVAGRLEQRKVEVGGREKEVVIAYSLGNFLTGNEKDSAQAQHAPAVFESLILNLEFSKTDGGTTITGVNYVPLYITDNGEGAADRYQVQNVYDVLAETSDADTITRMTDTIAHLKSSTQSLLDRGQ